MNQQDNFNPPANEEVALKEILSPLWSRRWKIVFFTLLITFFVAFYVSLLKPSYQATAILQIGTNKPANTLSINDAFNESTASHEQIQTQYELEPCPLCITQRIIYIVLGSIFLISVWLRLTACFAFFLLCYR